MMIRKLFNKVKSAAVTLYKKIVEKLKSLWPKVEEDVLSGCVKVMEDITSMIEDLKSVDMKGSAPRFTSCPPEANVDL
jgi:hypothetical protein